MRRAHRTAHARIWTVLGLLLPAMLIAAMLVRQNGPIERPPKLLEAPPGDVGEVNQ